MATVLSPPSSPRDHRHYIPRRPSPLSLPPLSPRPPITAGGTSHYQPFSLTAFVLDSPKAGSRVPRYPLEKQRRAWKELEDQKQQKQMQKQDPMRIQGSSSAMDLSPTSTLPLTPRSASSTYSDHENGDVGYTNSRVPNVVQRSFCGTFFGSCFCTSHFLSSGHRS